MKHQPKVSIIMPVYNDEEVLKESLDSALGQSLQDIEVICVDDGSSDGSLSILRNYNSNDRRVKVLEQQNQGAGVARNAALDIATGKYIAFLDSDDLYPDSNVLQELVEAAERNVALICGGSLQYLRDGKIESAQLSGESFSFAENAWVDYRSFQQDYYYQRFIYNRAMLENNGIRFPHFRRYQDPPFFVRAMLAAGSFYALSRPAYVYRAGTSYLNYTPEKIYDMLEGMLNELDLTREARLEQLHYKVASRVEYMYNSRVKRSEVANSYQTRQALLKIRNAIDFELTQKNLDLTYLDLAIGDCCANSKDNTTFSDHKEPVFTRMSALRDNTDDIPKVSVIIPIYNVEAFLGECLNSVTSQSLKEIEILCINDGSTDNSLLILEKAASYDNRISIICQKNAGLSAARNTGTKIARGKYIYFLDSDDYIDIGALEYLFITAEEHSLDVLYFDGESFFDPPEIKSLFPEKDPCYRSKEYGDIYTGQELYVAMRKDGVYRPMAWMQFILRKYYEEKNLKFHEGVLHEDVAFSATCILQASRVSHRKKQLYHYRRRNNAITSAAASFERTRGKLTAFLDLIALFCSINLNDEVKQHMASYLDWLTDAIMEEYEQLPISEKEMANSLSPIDRYILEILQKAYLYKRAIKTGVSVAAKVTNTGATKKVDNTQFLREIESMRASVSVLNKEIQAIHSSLSYRLGRFFTFIPRKLRGGIRCYHEHGMRYTLFRVGEKVRAIFKKKNVYVDESGIYKGKRKPKIIISLTSFPARIGRVATTLEPIFKQTMKPDMIILWLASDEFPNRELELPDSLLRLKQFGLTIKWCDNLKSHKKYQFVMKKYPNDIIITIDDDLIYQRDLVERLYRSYQRYPNAVSALRVHKIVMNDDETLAPYASWPKEDESAVGEPSMLMFATTGAGTLFPPHILPKEALNESEAMRLCPSADDVWLKVMEMVGNVKVVLADRHRPLRFVAGTQEVALWESNVQLGENDRQFIDTMKAYEVDYRNMLKWHKLENKDDNLL